MWRPASFCVLLGPMAPARARCTVCSPGLLACQSGAIELFGQAFVRPAMAGLGVVFQQPTLDLDLTVEQNLAYFAALPDGLRRPEAARAHRRRIAAHGAGRAPA